MAQAKKRSTEKYAVRLRINNRLASLAVWQPLGCLPRILRPNGLVCCGLPLERPKAKHPQFGFASLPVFCLVESRVIWCAVAALPAIGSPSLRSSLRHAACTGYSRPALRALLRSPLRSARAPSSFFLVRPLRVAGQTLPAGRCSCLARPAFRGAAASFRLTPQLPPQPPSAHAQWGRAAAFSV